MAGVLGTSTITQVAFIVKDVEATKQSFAAFLGVPVPPTCDGGEFAVTGTTLYGEPAPEANCKMAFFDVGPNVQLELIEPNGKPSVWQEFLDTNGEGIHHIAFGVKDTDKKILAMEKNGFPCVQRGKYGDGGGEYAYFDARQQLKCFVETLESYPKS
ncbi:MAG: VOC family protein [Clostridiales bacterium]|nr:VOC family protein [Clostridiales bacterium]